MGSYLSSYLNRYLGTDKAPRPIWPQRARPRKPRRRRSLLGIYLGRFQRCFLSTRKAAQKPRSARPRPTRRGALLGSFLGPREVVLRSSTQEHRFARPGRPQDPKLLVSTPRLPTVQPGMNHARASGSLATKALRHPLRTLPVWLVVTPGPLGNRYHFPKRRRWAAKYIRGHQRGMKGLFSSGCSGSRFSCPPPEEKPDPCAKETVQKALSQCNKGKRKFDGPLWFEVPDPKISKQSPAPTPSAFKPVTRDGVPRPFVPRPGRLKRGVGSPWVNGVPSNKDFPQPAQPAAPLATEPMATQEPSLRASAVEPAADATLDRGSGP